MARKTNNSKQGQSMTSFHYVTILAILSVLNVSFFFGFGFSPTTFRCSTDLVMESVSVYLDGNGAPVIERLLQDSCGKPSIGAIRELDRSVRQLISHCKNTTDKRSLPVSKEPTITVFTTFADHLHTNTEKILVHNNTIKNWAKLRPRVNLILFVNDSLWVKPSKQHGWETIELSDEGNRPPVLKEMFSKAMKRFKTPWYGYVNGDILFTSELLDNLDFFTNTRNVTADRIMLTGRRTNIDKLSLLDPTSDANLTETARMYGTLYREDAEDFFITTRVFPWEHILPVVVGRPGYDNWLVREARCNLQVDVIDLSNTLLAVHQTTMKGGNHEGHMHPLSNYNFEVFKKNQLTPNFLAGITDCIPFFTYYDFCKQIQVAKQTNFGHRCSCQFR
ncbi:uncharacterized protein LOC128209604 [Mya arenaria]|nr:uncharacterized protein LOC128209604 [Mya arenaria]XP_052769662.1 uncharacterized protein LOC128209604 [Mya arenaria]